MGMHKERCPKCRKLRRRVGAFDAGGAAWALDPELKRPVCPTCSGMKRPGVHVAKSSREERHAAKQPLR